LKKRLGTCVISEQLQQDFAPQPSLLSAMIIKDKSQCYYLLGQMKEADLYTSKCKSIFEQLPDFQALRQYRDFLRDMGVNYINFNNFSEAKEVLLKRDEYIRSQTNIDSLELASSISDDAYLELTMGNYEYALQKLLSAKSIMELHPAEKKSFFYWDLLRNLGSGYKLIQKLDSAEFYFLQCNELSEELASITPDHRASIYLELGNLYLEKKQFKESKDYLERALTLIKDLFGEEHPLYYYILGFLGQYYFINSADTSNSAY
jgi:tetratricopeptide (TPR) repeat protein